MAEHGVPLLCPYPNDLTVLKKIKGVSEAHMDVFNSNGNLLFQINGTYLQLQKKRIMRDPSGLPILTMREKVLTLRHRWTVHRGESSDAANLLYSVQRSSALQVKTRLDVFLANNVSESVCDFHVIGSYKDQSFKVYQGNTLIAEATHEYRVGSFILKGEESFGVRVYTGQDYAFILSILVILNEIDEWLPVP